MFEKQFFSFHNFIVWNTNIAFVTAQVIQRLKPGTTTQEMDILSAKNCGVALAFKHPDYSMLAARIEMSNLSKATDSEFATFIKRVYKTGVLCETFYENVMKNTNQLDLLINHEYDCEMNYFDFKTLKSFYLMKVSKPAANAIRFTVEKTTECTQYSVYPVQ